MTIFALRGSRASIRFFGVVLLSVKSRPLFNFYLITFAVNRILESLATVIGAIYKACSGLFLSFKLSMMLTLRVTVVFFIVAITFPMEWRLLSLLGQISIHASASWNIILVIEVTFT